MTCYHFDEDVENEDNINKATFEASHCSVANVSFSYEDMLLGFASHNQPFFDISYAHEQRINRILIDDGSAINILP